MILSASEDVFEQFKPGSVNISQISQKVSTILDSVKQQGLDAKEFSIEMDIEGNGGNQAQFSQKIVPVLDSIKQNDLNAKEFELEISTGTSDVPQAKQKVSSIVQEIKRQGFEVKELEVESDKEE